MLVYTTQVNSPFGSRWLASPEVIFQASTVLFTFEQPKRKKIASRFASISEKEILSMNEEAVPKSTKMATKFGVTVFNDKLFDLSSLIFWSEKSKCNALFTVKTMKHLMFFSLVLTTRGIELNHWENDTAAI